MERGSLRWGFRGLCPQGQGWLQSCHFMWTLVFSEGISTFLGTKEVLLVMSIQLQVKSKYDDYILVHAQSSLVPAFPVSPGSHFMGTPQGMGKGRSWGVPLGPPSPSALGLILLFSPTGS